MPYLMSTPIAVALMTLVWLVRSPEVHSSELSRPWTMTGIPRCRDWRIWAPAAPQALTVNHSVGSSRHSPVASR